MIFRSTQPIFKNTFHLVHNQNAQPLIVKGPNFKPFMTWYKTRIRNISFYRGEHHIKSLSSNEGNSMKANQSTKNPHRHRKAIHILVLTSSFQSKFPESSLSILHSYISNSTKLVHKHILFQFAHSQLHLKTIKENIPSFSPQKQSK